MVVPAPSMEAQGTICSLIKRRVEATTTCLGFSPPSQAATATGKPAAGFAVHVTCHVIMHIRAGRGQEGRSYEYRRGDGAEATCFVAPGSGEDGVRDALRRALRSIRALQDLSLTDGEWESIVPEDDVVPLLADPEAQRCHAAAEVRMAVVRNVRYNAARVLMTGCTKVDNGVSKMGDADCIVCFDALLSGEAVELPGCAHAFHRRCISKWFSRKPTCPLCREDVVEHLDPELQKHIALGSATPCD